MYSEVPERVLNAPHCCGHWIGHMETEHCGDESTMTLPKLSVRFILLICHLAEAHYPERLEADTFM